MARALQVLRQPDDLPFLLCDWEGEDVWPAYRDALLEGYLMVRSLPEEQLGKLELFQAAFRAVEIFLGDRWHDATFGLSLLDGEMGYGLEVYQALLEGTSSAIALALSLKLLILL